MIYALYTVYFLFTVRYLTIFRPVFVYYEEIEQSEKLVSLCTKRRKVRKEREQ